jgi:xylulokinase
MERIALACDVGTSSLKTALVDSSGRVLASARVRFPEARRNARDWLVAFSEAVACLRATVTRSGGEIPDYARAFAPDAIAISGNGPTLVAVDSRGEAGPVLLWNDAVPGAIREPGSVAGERPESNSLFIPRILAYRDLFPAPYDRARHLLSGPEYLAWALTGNAATILPEPRFEAAYWTDEENARAGIDGSRLAPFVPIGQVMGTASAAHLTSIAGAGVFPKELAALEGIPVIAGGPDFVVALVGTNTLSPGTACDRAGTSEGLNVCTPTRIAHRSIRALPSVIAGLWNASYLLPDTGAAFHAWRIGTAQRAKSYPELMEGIERSPINPKAGEALHPGRAVVERIGFAVRRGVETLREATGFEGDFALSGGQARNETWNQMKADITGAAFALTTTADGELMGDAIIAFAALGSFGSVPEAADAMVRVARRYEPDPERYRAYTERYLKQ